MKLIRFLFYSFKWLLIKSRNGRICVSLLKPSFDFFDAVLLIVIKNVYAVTVLCFVLPHLTVKQFVMEEVSKET